jgi:hypothetical protein
MLDTVEMQEALLPLVRLAATLSADIKEYDKKIEELGREKYGHTTLLRQLRKSLHNRAGNEAKRRNCLLSLFCEAPAGTLG